MVAMTNARAAAGAIQNNPVSKLFNAQERLREAVSGIYHTAAGIVGPIPSSGGNPSVRPVPENPSLMDKIEMCSDDINTLAAALEDAATALQRVTL